MSLLQTSLIPRTLHFLSKTHTHRQNAVVKPFPSITLSHNPDPPKPKPKSPTRRRKPEPKPKPESNPEPSAEFPKPIPRKPRRGRRSEAAAVEDYVRARLEETFAAMQEQNPELFKDKDKIFKAKRAEEDEDDE